MPPTLLDLASLVVAKLYPFQLIEERYKLIPEPVQRKIIFHAFPRQPQEIFNYSNYFNDEEKEWKNNFYDCKDVLQVGFLLSGRVGEGKGCGGESVRIQFDRCKITNISCSCTTTTQTSKKTLQEKLIFWCDHVVALALYRICNADQVELRVPISETLATLSRSQLQKLLQYLLHDHPSVLPTTQTLADKLLANKNNEINAIHGAPDITAGASTADENSWTFNEQNMAELIKENIYDEAKLEGIVGGLFKKIHTMTTHSDTNAPRILTLITQTFLQNKPPHRTILWDQLVTLWQITCMSPNKTISTREKAYTNLLLSFNSHPNIPLDENNVPLLKKCLTLLKTDYTKKTTDLKSNCLRVQSLYCHGFKKQSACLGLRVVKMVRTLPNYTLDYDLATIVYNVLIPNHPQEATEFALLSLGQNRAIPPTLYLQEKWLKTEESFLTNLKLPLDKQILEMMTSIFLAKSYTSSLPLYNFAKFLYKQNTTEKTFRLAIKYLKMPILTTFIQTNLEHQQVNLSLLLINTAKDKKKDLDTLLKTLSTCLKSVSCLFRIAESSRLLEETNSNLINFSFNLGLHVLKTTLKYNHRRRWDIVRWVMNSSLTCGFGQVIHLLTNWTDFFTPNEAVGTVANQFLSRGTSLRLNLGFQQQQSLGEAARNVAIGGMRVDTGNCSLSALTICESDPVSFETAYQILMESAKQPNVLNCQQIFTTARYMEHRGYPLRAYKLAAIAIGHLHIPFNQETHSSISDIHWTCTLAQSIGDSELCNLLPVIISNIKCASVLSEILKRAAMEPPRKCPRNSGNTSKIYSRLKLLVEATINSYITTIHNRLAHISPRHYADFIEYLGKAKEVFQFAPEGVVKFRGVIQGIKKEYKGKKKLVVLVGERFG